MLGYAWGIISNTGSVAIHVGSLGWVLASATVSTVLAGVAYYRGHHLEASLSLVNAGVTMRDEFEPLTTAVMGGVPGVLSVVSRAQGSNSHTVRAINHTGLVAIEAVLLASEIVVDTAALVVWGYRSIRDARSAPREALLAITYPSSEDSDPEEERQLVPY